MRSSDSMFPISTARKPIHEHSYTPYSREAAQGIPVPVHITKYLYQGDLIRRTCCRGTRSQSRNLQYDTTIAIPSANSIPWVSSMDLLTGSIDLRDSEQCLHNATEPFSSEHTRLLRGRQPQSFSTLHREREIEHRYNHLPRQRTCTCRTLPGSASPRSS